MPRWLREEHHLAKSKHFPRRCSRNSSPFKINQPPPSLPPLRRKSFQISFATVVLGKRATTGEEKRVLYTLCSVLVCAISHGRRFWPITLTRLTGIYPERECAYYRPHTVADILDLVTARVTIHEYFDVLLEKKNKSRKKGLVSHSRVFLNIIILMMAG